MTNLLLLLLALAPVGFWLWRLVRWRYGGRPVVVVIQFFVALTLFLFVSLALVFTLNL